MTDNEEPTKFTLTRENYVEVAKWIGPDVRISSPWKNPKLHFETGFADHGGFKTTASLGDTIEKLPDGKIQIWVAEQNVASDEKPKMENRPEMLLPEHFGPIAEARVLVLKMFYGPKSEVPLALDEVYVVWFCKTLQNWKAMVSSNAKDDAYYEVTHNGDKNETYVDRYIKETNTVYHNETGMTDVTLVNNFGRIY